MKKSNEIVVVRAAIVGKGDEILALQRAPGKNAKNSGLWELPGGKVDRGEAVEAALLREVWEETGLEIIPITPLLPYNSYVIQDGNKTGTTYRALCCRAIASSGAFQLSKEHVAFMHELPTVMAQSPDFRADTALAIAQLF